MTRKCDFSTVLEHKKIVFIGGYEFIRKKLKQKYCNLDLIDGSNKGFSVSSINQADIVFIYPDYMSHSTYYKAINVIRKHNIPYHYIKKTNIDLIEKEMTKTLVKTKAKGFNPLA